MNLQHWFGLNVIIIYPLVLTEQGTQRLTGAQTNQWSLLAINKELRLRKKGLAYVGVRGASPPLSTLLQYVRCQGSVTIPVTIVNFCLDLLA